MAFPISPVDGETYKNYKYNTAINAWVKIELEKAENNGDLNLGTLHMIDYSNKNSTTFWSKPSPVDQTTYLSPDLTSRIPAEAKAVILRWWVQKTGVNGGDWYWCGFRQSDLSIVGDATTIASGAELTYATYHHTTITIPIGDTNRFNVFWTGVGSYGSFNCNPIGYYI